MKRNTPDHPKMHDLAERLGLPLYAAVGIMEMLWHYAGKYTPRGDIGRVSDQVIARAIDWRKNAGKLVDALVDAHWLDRSEDHRLIIHHWPEHCEEAVKKALQRSGETFLGEYGQYLDSVGDLSRQNSDKKQTKSASREARLGLAVAEAEVSEGGAGGNQPPKLPPGFAMDELYLEFRTACRDWGQNVIDEDFTGDAWFEWGRLDGLSRVAAVAGIRARQGAGEDPRYAKSPAKYLKTREFKRPVVAKKSKGWTAEEIAAL